ALAGAPDSEVVAAVQAYLEGCFGPCPCERSDVTGWEGDPWSLGAYSFYAAGAAPDAIEALAAPSHGGRLLIAGEGADEEFQGSVPAAYLSGARAAEAALSGLRRGWRSAAA
ncbi:unnamed protein product, partial [Prorocentrum cordatum]